MKKSHLLLSLLAASMLLASCGKSSSENKPTVPSPDTTDTGTDTSPGTDTNPGTDTTPGTDDTDSSGDEVNTFPFQELNEYLSETGVTIPVLNSTAPWVVKIEDETFENGPRAIAYTYDDDTTLEVENAYNEVVKATDWKCINDEKYTYDSYGYMYVDPTEEVQIQYYTYEGFFQLFVFILDNFTNDDIGQYTGDTWNSDFINNAFVNYPEFIDLLPVFATSPDNSDIYFDFYDGTETNDGEPYLELYVMNPTLAECEAWFNAIDEEGKLYSYVSMFGDDKGCEAGCEKGFDAFVNHGYEIFGEDSDTLFIEVTNHLDNSSEPYIEIEVMYWGD